MSDCRVSHSGRFPKIAAPTARMFAMILFICVGTWSRAESDSALLWQKLSVEGPPAWHCLEQHFGRVEGTGKRTQVSERTGKTNAVRKETIIEFKINGVNQEALFRGVTTGAEQVMCVNSKYNFTLARGTPDRNFSITAFQDGPPVSTDSPLISTEDLVEVYFEQFLKAPWVIDGRSLDRIINGRGFHLIGIESIGSTHAPLVQVRFSYQPTDMHEAPFTDAFVTLRPDANWSIRHYEYSLNDGRLIGDIDYGGTMEGIPTLSKVSLRAESAQHQPISHTIFEFERLVPSVVPEANFTLTAFGLPELSESEPSRRWFLLLNVGVICLVVAVWIYRRARMVRG
jgi:hypothetical protein